MEEGVIAGIPAGAIAFILLIIAIIRDKSKHSSTNSYVYPYIYKSSSHRLTGTKGGMKSKTKKNK